MKTRWVAGLGGVLEQPGGPDRRGRVEPAPDAAGPEQHAVVRADAGQDALHDAAPAPGGRGSSGMPKGTTSISDRSVGSRRYGPEVDQAVHRHAAEPQVALALARADDEVGHRALGQRAHADQALDAPLGARRLAGHRLEHLHDDRVVEVERDTHRAASEAAPAGSAAAPGPPRTSCSRAAAEQQRRSPRSRPRASARPPGTVLAAGAASVTSQPAPASARASSAARIAGPAIRSATGSDESTRTEALIARSASSARRSTPPSATEPRRRARSPSGSSTASDSVGHERKHARHHAAAATARARRSGTAAGGQLAPHEPQPAGDHDQLGRERHGRPRRRCPSDGHQREVQRQVERQRDDASHSALVWRPPAISA